MTHRNDNIYQRGLDRGPANYQPLTPLSFLEWSAAVYPDNQVGADGVDVLDRAELARGDVLPHLADAGVEEEHMPDGEDQALGLGELDQFLAARQRATNRLLNQDVLAGAEGLASEFVVGVDRRGDDDRIGGRVFDGAIDVGGSLDAGNALGDERKSFRVEIAGVVNIGAGEIEDRPNEIRPPPSGSDAVECGHGCCFRFVGSVNPRPISPSRRLFLQCEHLSMTRPHPNPLPKREGVSVAGRSPGGRRDGECSTSR